MVCLYKHRRPVVSGPYAQLIRFSWPDFPGCTSPAHSELRFFPRDIQIVGDSQPACLPFPSRYLTPGRNGTAQHSIAHPCVLHVPQDKRPLASIKAYSQPLLEQIQLFSAPPLFPQPQPRQEKKPVRRLLSEAPKNPLRLLTTFGNFTGSSYTVLPSLHDAVNRHRGTPQKGTPFVLNDNSAAKYVLQHI